MSWIQNNKFLAVLGGVTLIVLVVLSLFGYKGSGRYLQAKEDFNIAGQEAQAIERLPLYPKRQNLDGKTKAIDDYTQEIESLQKAFQNYRPEELQNISPEAFTTQLKSANQEIRNAFQAANTLVPDPFFLGFENYKTSLAGGDATGILEYQLSGIKQLLLALAAAGPTELKNFHRPSLVEEQGQKFIPQPTDVARRLPLEITFRAPEKAVRAFLSSVVKTEGRHYIVIRSLRIVNEKKSPPRTADAKFEKPAAAKSGNPADQFAAFFAPETDPKPADPKPADPKPENPKPGDGNAPKAEPGATPAGPEPAVGAAPEPAPATPTVDNRILSQVLGDEQLQVFLRLDLMLFLPAKKLP